MNTTRLIAAIALLAFANVAQADDPDCNPGSDAVLQSFASEEITVSTTAKILTAATYAPTGAQRASLAFMTISGAAARARFDGIAPTTEVGHVIADGSGIKVCTVDIAKFQIIRDDAVDVELSVTYYRPPNQ